ncbi:MAG: class I SAM-dependent methyltransferase [Labilithrix sp.]|nr:class I SAM-dependent methyltransferase [Labilithrix sp.]
MTSQGLSALGVPESALEPIEGWLDLLRQWNRRIDLTAARSDDELVDLMLADALVLARREPALLIPEGASVVDVGTGAGAPGLALALLRPDLRVTLVEPLAKRISFLRTVIGTLGRTDIVLRRERVLDVVQSSPGAWDVAMSRATLAPAEWTPLALKLAPSAWTLLAREEPPEIPGAKLAEDVAYTWPLTGAARRAVRYEAGA